MLVTEVEFTHVSVELSAEDVHTGSCLLACKVSNERTCQTHALMCETHHSQAAVLDLLLCVGGGIQTKGVKGELAHKPRLQQRDHNVQKCNT